MCVLRVVRPRPESAVLTCVFARAPAYESACVCECCVRVCVLCPALTHFPVHRPFSRSSIQLSTCTHTHTHTPGHRLSSHSPPSICALPCNESCSNASDITADVSVTILAHLPVHLSGPMTIRRCLHNCLAFPHCVCISVRARPGRSMITHPLRWAQALVCALVEDAPWVVLTALVYTPAVRVSAL